MSHSTQGNSVRKDNHPVSRCSRRHLKPRRDDYPGHLAEPEEDAIAEAVDQATILKRMRQAEDQSDSYEIIRRNRGKELDTKDAWHKSMAYSELGPEQNHTGIWIPQWVGRSIHNARLARLFSWILWWFDDEGTRSQMADRGCERVSLANDGGPARARYFDKQRRRWLMASCRKLAHDVLMPRSTVARNLTELQERRLIEIQDGKMGRMLVRPRAVAVARAYYKVTNDRVALEEFGPPSYAYAQKLERWNNGELQYEPGWYESATREKAMNRYRYGRDGQKAVICIGTFVTDHIMLACQRKPGPAWVLSQILWWFSVDGGGLTRARITRRGYLWIAKSPRQLSQELGLDRKRVKDHLDYLIEDRGFLVREFWPFKSRQSRGQKTLHLRPNPDRILEAIEEVSDEAFRISQERWQGY